MGGASCSRTAIPTILATDPFFSTRRRSKFKVNTRPSTFKHEQCTKINLMHKDKPNIKPPPRIFKRISKFDEFYSWYSIFNVLGITVCCNTQMLFHFMMHVANVPLIDVQSFLPEFVYPLLRFKVYISWSSSYMIFRSTLFWDAYVVVFVLKKDKHTVLSFENMWKTTFSKVLWKLPTSFYYMALWHINFFLLYGISTEMINIKQHHINLNEIRRDRKFLTDDSSEEPYVKNFQS